MEKLWYVYMLRCKDDTLYTGITNEPERRLAQHNAGTASKCTRSRRPVSMVYCEEVEDKSAALRREHALKQLTRAQKLDIIASQAPDRVSRLPQLHP